MKIEKLIEVLKNEFVEIADREINVSTVIDEIIPFSSLNIAILLTCIELEFDIIIQPIELKKCNTVGDLYEHILSKK